ncbi:hypothetical protein [Amycolatopsis sp. DSM 110486]|uniref:hypothetical protein n=1 Tax=Amycolatopsis sp. DSM 110486 TaxID=2865832 RepID=UPI001C69E528|nr:hypothetical protein [Amycolatopsis sp. DSM 110486]QYN18927.1 hypothetical protein K1T34_40565 [Amycolatopsis sp. DSM 110486]
MVKAAAENDQDDWRRLALDPVLEVNYNSVPGLPADLGMEGGQIPCASGDARPFVFTPTPRLRGRVSDPDGGMLTARFSLHKGKLGASSEIWWTTTANIPSGSYAEVTVPTGLVTAEGVYNWSMYASDGGANSIWVGNCEFEVDKTAPGSPSVTSDGLPRRWEHPSGWDRSDRVVHRRRKRQPGCAVLPVVGHRSAERRPEDQGQR